MRYKGQIGQLIGIAYFCSIFLLLLDLLYPSHARYSFSTAESLDIDLGDYTYWVPEGTAYPRSKIIKDAEQRDRRHEGKFILLDGFDYKGRKCLQICDVFVTKIETYVVDITINMAEVHGNRTHLSRV